MHERLRAIDDRLKRADENLDRIKEYLRAYYASDFHDLVVEFDPSGEGAFFRGGVATPPVRVFTLVGDVLHELRSTLDHIAWQLVSVNGGEPTRDTYWPILQVRPTPNRHGVSKPPHIAGGVAEAALRIVDVSQPYQFGPDFADHPLWLLNELNRRDKHRHVAIKTARLTSLSLSYDDTIRLSACNLTVVTAASDEYGATLSLVADDPSVNVNAQAFLRVVMHEPDAPSGEAIEGPLLDNLIAMRDAVTDVFRDIESACF